MNTINGILHHNTMSTKELQQHVGETVKIHGSIYKIRRMKDFAFILLRTKRDVLQCIYSGEWSSFSPETLREESCVTAVAQVIPEERAKTGFDLHLLDVTILSAPKDEPPIVINNKLVDTSIENLLRFRPVTLRNERQRAIFKIQEGICAGFRAFLMQEGFTEIHSPKIVQSGAEGGSNIFRLNYFGQEAYLAQSPQFYKQMMVGVFEQVFEIAPVFRAEKHDTSRHLNEYISVDFEMGYIESFEEIMQTETAMLKYALAYLQEHYPKELELLQIKLPVIESIPAIPFRHAKELLEKECGYAVTDWEDFEPAEEKLLGEYILRTTGSEFVFVTHYPSSKRPFYAMDSSGDLSVTESFDLFFRGLEVTTGGQRIHDYDSQLAKIIQRGMHPELFESYLMLHKYGMPPHGGLGLGLERFVSRLLNLDNVRYASLFPRDIHRLQP